MHLTDEEDPEGVLARLVASLAPGSHVVVNDGSNVLGAPGADGADDTARARAIARYVEAGGVAYNPEVDAFCGVARVSGRRPGGRSPCRWGRT
ncbi:hypothetical protein ACIBI3_10995 [Actinomadura luteofluorescens]|uniref:hypothetical protein n=1 Tax=Actinomadura luteofluorescens TaxID=46163 RepID=UPI003482FC9D